MSEVTTYSEEFRRRYDPTHTTSLRNAYAADMKRRFTHLAKNIKIGVDDNDCFGLKKGLFFNQVIPPQSFAALQNKDKLTAFVRWLEGQVRSGILTVGELEQIGSSVAAMWQNLYLFDSYKRGLLRARYEMSKIGMDIPPIEEVGGITMLVSLPFHVERLGLIYTRAYTDLQGITAAMDSVISRILAQGLADGDAPRLLAQKLVSVINGSKIGELGLTDALGRYITPINRAMILARTETIRAHHLAMMQEYRNWGILGIKVLGEWKTAGDERVCNKCAELEGKIFTIDEIEPMIPLHPMCRCIALPYIEN